MSDIPVRDLSIDDFDTNIRVRLAKETDLSAWQQFVDQMPQAGCMHHAGWYAVLRDSCWVKPYFLIAEDARSGEYTGILPLYHSTSPLTGSHLSSLGHGILAENQQTVAALLDHARSFRDSIGAKYLELRGGPLDHPGDQAFTAIRTLINTDQPPEILWRAIKKRTRQAIRQAEKAAIRIECDATLAELDDFYWTYAEHIRKFGTPVMGIGFFRAIRTQLGNHRLRLYWVKEDQRLIGGMLCILNSRCWTAVYGAVLPSQQKNFANYLLYWHVIRDASIYGAPVLDLGRSAPESNVRLFKRKWGGKEIEVAYERYFARPKIQNDRPRPHDDSVRDSLRRRKGLLYSLWSHLPLPLCNSLGPLIRKQLPFM
jgi:FemAB-related protein (PEP-CTERM system-associated)